MPKGHPHSKSFKAAVRRAYLELPRAEPGRLKPGKNRKLPATRVKPGKLQAFLKKYGLSEVALWRLVYDLQPWNKP